MRQGLKPNQNETPQWRRRRRRRRGPAKPQDSFNACVRTAPWINPPPRTPMHTELYKKRSVAGGTVPHAIPTQLTTGERRRERKRGGEGEGEESEGQTAATTVYIRKAWTRKFTVWGHCVAVSRHARAHLGGRRASPAQWLELPASGQTGHQHMQPKARRLSIQ